MSSSDPDLPNVVADFANPRAIDILAESENLKLRGGLYGEKVTVGAERSTSGLRI